MAGVLVTYSYGDVFVGGAIIGIGIINIFYIGGAKDEWLAEKLFLHVAILASAYTLTIDWLTLILIDTVLPFRISQLFVKLFRLSVLVQYGTALTVENGEDDCVATAT